MDIRTARKIADNVGDVGLDDQTRRRAFHRLDIAVMKATDKAQRRSDHARAQMIWNYFGNRATKGKTVAA